MYVNPLPPLCAVTFSILPSVFRFTTYTHLLSTIFVASGIDFLQTLVNTTYLLSWARSLFRASVHFCAFGELRACSSVGWSGAVATAHIGYFSEGLDSLVDFSFSYFLFPFGGRSLFVLCCWRRLVYCWHYYRCLFGCHLGFLRLWIYVFAFGFLAMGVAFVDGYGIFSKFEGSGSIHHLIYYKRSCRSDDSAFPWPWY